MFTINHLFKPYISSKFLTTPTVPTVIWLICGIICALFKGNFEERILIYLLCFILSTITFILCVQIYKKAIIFFFFGFLLGLLFIKPPWQTYLYHLPSHDCHATLSGIVLSTTTNSYSTKVITKINKLQLYDQPPINVQGKVEIQSYSYSTKIPELKPGMSFTVEGAFTTSTSLDTFNYQNYLASQKIFKLFTASYWKSANQPQGFERWHEMWWRYKNHLNDRLLSGLKNDYKPILSAMLLGIKSDITSEVKNDFILAGTIHLLAVSGLHAAAIAWIIMKLLRLCKISYRKCWGLLIILLGFYVILTGASPSANRTWLMISVFAFHKLFLRYTSPLQAISLAAFIQLCFNPWLIFNNGFQFSYIIVLSLFLALPLIERLYNILIEVHLWKPFFSPQPSSVIKSIFSWSMGSITAWGASAGLTLFYNQLFIPFSIFINILIIHLASLLLGGGICKILFSDIPFINTLINSFLDFILTLIDFLTHSFTDFSLNFFCPRLHFGWIIIYYFLFWGFLLIKNYRKYFLSTLLLFFAITILIPYFSTPSKQNMYISFGGTLYTPIIIIKEKYHDPIVITSTNNQNLRLTSLFLAKKNWSPKHLFFLQKKRSNRPEFQFNSPLNIRMKNINQSFIYTQKNLQDSYWEFPQFDLVIKEMEEEYWTIIYQGKKIKLDKQNQLYWLNFQKIITK